MSFAQDVKREIISREIHKSCCKKAAAYGFVCFSKYFDAKGLIIHTEQSSIAQYAKKIFSDIDVQGKIFATGKEGSRIYEFAVKESVEIDKLFEIFGHSKKDISININSDNLVCEHCVSAFLSSAFLSAGTITNPQKDYNLEFITNKHNLSQGLTALLKGHDFLPGNIVRKGSNIIYFKASEQIEDLLTFMGASGAALEIMNLKVYKDFRNKANRITNCETANIDKMVEANGQTLSAIKYLKQQGAYETMPENLREAAKLREENPEISLKELAACFNPPLSKSGLCHRLRRISEIANALSERNKNV
ncbi:MAG: DNA-binding protein WhiA [Oscillospiraceae bacterium]